MPCDLRTRAVCALLVLAAACSSSDEKLGKAPPKFTREAANAAAPVPPDGGTDMQQGPLVFMFGADAGLPCCMTKFSLPATLGGEVSVTLRGDPALAIDGYPLKKKSGVWQGAACVPLDAGGTYYYELAFPGEQEDGGTLEGDAGLFITQRYNPKQPTASSSTFGTVNVIAPKSSCN